jgi:hypothetical protein
MADLPRTNRADHPSRLATRDPDIGGAEDAAGVLIVLVIAASSALAAFEAMTRLAHPHPVSNLVAVAIAALIGFTGNGVIARYGIGVGRRIRSAALVVPSGTDFAPFLMRQARSAPRAENRRNRSMEKKPRGGPGCR